MIEAEANRLATPNAATPRYGQCNRQALQLYELLACNVNAFLLDGHRPFSFNGKKMGGALGSSALALHFPSAMCAERHSHFGDKKENHHASSID